MENVSSCIKVSGSPATRKRRTARRSTRYCGYIVFEYLIHPLDKYQMLIAKDDKKLDSLPHPIHLLPSKKGELRTYVPFSLFNTKMWNYLWAPLVDNILISFLKESIFDVHTTRIQCVCPEDSPPSFAVSLSSLLSHWQLARGCSGQPTCVYDPHQSR